MTNKEISDLLLQLSDRLEAAGDNPYRVRAYRRAARGIYQFEENIKQIVKQNGDLTQIPGVGKGIALRIKEIVLQKQPYNPVIQKKKKFVDELQSVALLGPKRRKILREQLNIVTKNDLSRAIDNNALINLPGFNTKLIERIKANLPFPKPYKFELRLYHAMPVVNALVEQLSSLPHVSKVEAASSFRRRNEVVGTIAIIVASDKPQKVIEAFVDFLQVKEIVLQEESKVTVRLVSGLQVNLYVVSKEQFASTLWFHTGNTQHVEKITALGLQRKISLTAQGLKHAGRTEKIDSEKAIYETLGLSFIPPELREDRGEIAAAQKHKLPNLIELSDIKGDMHSHTLETDGTETLENMVKAAAMRGYEYLAITDHSQYLAITNGLDAKRLLKQIKLIDQLNEKNLGILILKSIELDILPDGRLDLSNDILKELDIVVCSVHSRFKLPSVEQTERILRAMDNPYFNILGHATGRLINRRKPYDIDVERILRSAKERNCFIELNAQPYRLDIHDQYCQLAKEIGVKVVISSDAHSVREFRYMQFGVFQARRGWLTREDVLNTRSWPEIKRLIKRS